MILLTNGSQSTDPRTHSDPFATQLGTNGKSALESIKARDIGVLSHNPFQSTAYRAAQWQPPTKADKVYSLTKF